MSEADQQPVQKKLGSIGGLVISTLIIGASQGLAYLGEGGDDGFLSPLTVMQSVAIISMVINVAMFVPSFVLQTEHYYDLTGSITYLTCVWYSFFAGSYDGSEIRINYRSIIVSCMVTVWAIRLGYFLFKRVKQSGKDDRFDRIKPVFFFYLAVWVTQGLWVYLTAFCAFLINADDNPNELYATDYVGFAVWLLGFGIEVVADQQKTAWRARPENKGNFIEYGLWYYSRHPNYFGEVTLWVGIFIISTGILNGTQWVAVVAPVFEFCLIYFISGVPLLEKKSDKKFGDREDYIAYKKNTSVFFILPKGVTCGIQTEVNHKPSSSS